jgi:hypothetical protein
LRLIQASGVDACIAAISEVVSGKARPDEGHVLGL